MKDIDLKEYYYKYKTLKYNLKNNKNKIKIEGGEIANTDTATDAVEAPDAKENFYSHIKAPLGSKIIYTHIEFDESKARLKKQGRSIEQNKEWDQQQWYLGQETYYKGDLNNNLKHGKGIFIGIRERIYDGDWINDKKHGQGTYTYKDYDYPYNWECIYIGEFKNDKKNGQGAEGKKHTGKYNTTETEFYTGQWKDDKKDGKGIAYSSEDFETFIYFKGEWEDDERNGEGISYYTDGSIYFKGKWKDDKKHGEGTEYYDYKNNKKLFEGKWEDGKRIGPGTSYHENGNIKFKGNFGGQSGLKLGQGIEYHENGQIKYDGEWSYDTQHGKGTFNYENGDIYKGNWHNGDKEGQGTYIWNDGRRYVGKWKNNYMDGKGILYDKDGNKTELKNGEKKEKWYKFFQKKPPSQYPWHL